MSHSHLTLEERVSIEIFVSMGMSCREMARRLGRSHSTVSRELRRNAGSAKKDYDAEKVGIPVVRKPKIQKNSLDSVKSHYVSHKRKGLVNNKLYYTPAKLIIFV